MSEKRPVCPRGDHTRGQDDPTQQAGLRGSPVHKLKPLMVCGILRFSPPARCELLQITDEISERYQKVGFTRALLTDRYSCSASLHVHIETTGSCCKTALMLFHRKSPPTGSSFLRHASSPGRHRTLCNTYSLHWWQSIDTIVSNWFFFTCVYQFFHDFLSLCLVLVTFEEIVFFV